MTKVTSQTNLVKITRKTHSKCVIDVPSRTPFSLTFFKRRNSALIHAYESLLKDLKRESKLVNIHAVLNQLIDELYARLFLKIIHDYPKEDFNSFDERVSFVLNLMHEALQKLVSGFFSEARTDTYHYGFWLFRDEFAYYQEKAGEVDG